MASGLVALLVLTRPLEHRATAPESEALPHTKGVALAIGLIRERGGRIEQHPTTFQADDRFKVQLTCASTHPVWWRVVVRQDDETSCPLIAESPVVCGNLNTLPGAFRITGVGPATVCVQIQPGHRLAVDPPTAAQAERGAWSQVSGCVTVAPSTE